VLLTGTGDAPAHVEGALAGWRAVGGEPVAVRLFPREADDLRALVLGCDVVYAGGGSPPNLLAVWRAHGLDAVLAEAWAAGVVLCGRSAGACCWFAGCLTDALGPGRLAPLRDGLGLLPGSLCAHHGDEPARTGAYAAAVARGELPPGWGLADAGALVFEDRELRAVLGAPAVRVERERAHPIGVGPV
jgi:cyanophycinase-like exopeptidase